MVVPILETSDTLRADSAGKLTLSSPTEPSKCLTKVKILYAFLKEIAPKSRASGNNRSTAAYLGGRAAEPSLEGVLGLQKDCHSFSI